MYIEYKGELFLQYLSVPVTTAILWMDVMYIYHVVHQCKFLSAGSDDSQFISDAWSYTFSFQKYTLLPNRLPTLFITLDVSCSPCHPLYPLIQYTDSPRAKCVISCSSVSHLFRPLVPSSLSLSPVAAASCPILPISY